MDTSNPSGPRPEQIAQRQLKNITRDRDVLARLDAGDSPTQVADQLNLTSATVERISRGREAIRARQVTPRPEEIIARYWVGETTHEQMMAALRNIDLTAGYIPEGSYDAWVRGTWEEVSLARRLGMLTEDDYRELEPRPAPDAVDPPAAVQFYTTCLTEDCTPRSAARGVLARDEESGRIYRWVANTRAWHRRRRDEANFYAPDITDDVQVEFTPASSADALTTLRRIPELDPDDEIERSVLQAYLSQLHQPGEVLNSSDLGLEDH